MMTNSYWALTRNLKEYTQPYHDRLEREILLRFKRITLEDYKYYLRQLATFIYPLEEVISFLPWEETGLDIRARLKMPWIIEDLKYWQINVDFHSLDGASPDYPSLISLGEGLGYLYVLEGSMWGGQFLYECLQKKIGLKSREGRRYFHGYGGKTKFMWESFCAIANLYGASHSDQNHLIMQKAAQTFDKLHLWFQKDQLHHE